MPFYYLDKQRSTTAVRTTNATSTQLFSYVVPSPGVHYYKAVVMAATDDLAATAVWEIAAAVKTTVALPLVPQLIGTLQDLLGGKKDVAAALWSASLAISSTNVVVNVAGGVGQNVNWVCYFSANTFRP